MDGRKFQHSGLCAGPVTPMKDNGDSVNCLEKVDKYRLSPMLCTISHRDVNLEVIPAYIDHLVRSGVNAVFLNGTTAEGLSMTVAERKLIAEEWIVAGRGKLDKIIVHCGALCLRDARELAAHAEQIGADAIAAVPSFYFAPNDIHALTSAVAEVASAAPRTPFIYYHNPGRTHVTVDMALFIEAAREEIPTFAGIKWAAPDIAGALKCISLHGDSITVMWANDDTLLAALSLGIKSFNGSSYSFTGPLAGRVIQHYRKGDTGYMLAAQTAQFQLKRIIDLLERNGKWLQAHKVIFEHVTGIATGPARLPLTPLTPAQITELKEGFDALSA